ncbi:MAG: DUF1015 domain-containing protein [Desulfotomaculales bacterium]
MAVVVPVRGLRYNPEAVEDLAAVVTPPYDVITPEAQAQYYARHPYNIIRLEYGKEEPGDDEMNNRYTRAAAAFAAWRERGVLIREKTPAFYLYEQEFQVRGKRMRRHGFFCAVRLERFERGVIMPHEETLAGPKKDRLELLRACRANFSPIFGLYADREGSVLAALLRAAGEPAVSFYDELGHAHRLWVITDAGTVNAVRDRLADRRILIADGHHRYETALAYADEQAGPGPHRYVMMVLVNLYDPGLVILPTHRLVREIGKLSLGAFMDALEEQFEIAEAPPASAWNFDAFLAGLASRGRHAFGLYAGRDRLYILKLRGDVPVQRLLPQDRSPAWRELDVAVLHHLVLHRILGIGPRECENGKALAYTRDAEGALRRVDGGEYRLAFFLNPTRVEEVVAVAEAGDRMPQKSTYFYPKLITGLVINPLA